MLKDKWVDRKNGVDINSADDINQVAHAVVDLERKIEDGVLSAEVHVGASAPVNGELLWVDTDEEDEEENEEAPAVAPPDLAANEGEDGYIKNRTHYVDEKGVIHKLPNKFIDADWMATSKENIDNSIVIPEQKLTGTTTMWSNLEMSIQPGITYDVHINDAVYPCIAIANGKGAIIGNNTSLTLNSYPFSITWAGGSATSGMFFTDGSLGSSVYLKVTGHSWTEYNTLPEEFLPESVAKKSDIPAPLVGTTDNIKPSEVAAALAEGRTVAITYGGSAVGDITFNSFMVGEDAISSSETMIATVHQLHGTLATDNWSYATTPISGGGDTSIDVTAAVGQTIIVKEVDKNGKPTKWESADYQPRTHWKEMEEVVPLTTITPFYYEALGVPMGNMADFDIVIGNKYKVTFDGVEYVCEAFTYTMAGMSAPAFGNTVVAGGANTGEPFAIFKMTGDAWSTIILFDMNPHSVRIEGEVATPIPVQYMTNAFPYYIEATAYWDNSSASNSPTDYTFSQKGRAMDAFSIGRDIRLKLQLDAATNDPDLAAIYTLIGVKIVPEGARYLFALPEIGLATTALMGNCEKYLILVETPDGTLAKAGL